MMKKIFSYSQLKTSLKNVTRPLVLVGGCFDILHYGHVKFLQSAKKHGTLLVALESDANVIRRKGVSRPIHKENQRAEVLRALTCVDYILLLPEMTKNEEYERLVEEIHPDIVAVTQGDSYLEHKKAQIMAIGGKIITIHHERTPSTTQLIKLLEIEKS